MKILISLILALLSSGLFAQKSTYVYRNPQDRSFNCYLKVVPEKGAIKGLIIRDFSRLPDTSQKSPYRLLDLALQSGFITVYTVSSPFFPELYYDDSGPALLDEMVNEVLQEHQIEDKPVFIGGISASGTRALRYAQYCASGKSLYGTVLCGVFAVDPPLDIERFYYSAERIDQRQLEGSMTEEAGLVLKAFREKVGGTPQQVPEAYAKASVYSHRDPDIAMLKKLLKIPIIIYHEPDMDWWIRERKADYYDINAIDIVAFVNELKILGHRDLNLINTTGKGFDRQGQRKPHSWTIVDEEELMQWIVERSLSFSGN